MCSRVQRSMNIFTRPTPTPALSVRQRCSSCVRAALDQACIEPRAPVPNAPTTLPRSTASASPLSSWRTTTTQDRSDDARLVNSVMDENPRADTDWVSWTLARSPLTVATGRPPRMTNSRSGALLEVAMWRGRVGWPMACSSRHPCVQPRTKRRASVPDRNPRDGASARGNTPGFCPHTNRQNTSKPSHALAVPKNTMPLA